jgi:hypothetical protein
MRRAVRIVVGDLRDRTRWPWLLAGVALGLIAYLLMRG